MARVIERWIKVCGKLVTESPIHIGGLTSNSDVDIVLAVDGQGRFYIPGTSLAGVFRAWMRECFPGDLTKQMWGFQEKEKGRDGNIGHASFVLIEDALLLESTQENALPLKDTNVELRDHVGIDRLWGAAAEQIKYDRAIIPCGTAFNLNLTLEIPQNPRPGYTDALDALLASLCEGEISIGAAKTRGLGKVKLLKKYQVKQYNLLTYEGILAALRQKGQDYQSNGKAKACTIPKLTITITWKPVGALMVKAEGEGIKVDILPLVSSVNQQIALVIPGSSIKGALRSQAERIIRTVCKIPLTPTPLKEPTDRFLEQVQVPLVENLFGTAAKHQQENKEYNNEGSYHKPGLGALSVDDCYNCNKMDFQQWQGVTQAKDGQELRTALDNTPIEQTQQAFHVPIDRWTGGAADGLLYNNLEPFGVEWENISLTLNFRRISESEWQAVIALLILTLRDLHAGRIPLGYGVNRGMGAITIEKIIIHGKGLTGTSLENLEIQENIELNFTSQGSIEILNADFLTLLNKHWQAWIECNSY